MAMYGSIQAPIRYIDSLEQRRHIALFYEDAEYGRLIEFRFIKNGLKNGEQCIYATDEDSGSIVLQFLSYGIPLRYFQNGMLRVIQIRREAYGRDDILKKGKKDLEVIKRGLMAPFRIVSRIVPDVSTLDEISVEIELEREVHSHFDDFGGSLICPYDLSRIERTKKKEWLQGLRETHNTIIYAPSSGQGGVFSFS